MAKRLNKSGFKYGGEQLNLTKSTKEAAVIMDAGAKVPKGEAKNARSIDGFHLLKSNRSMEAKLDKLRDLPQVKVGSHVYYVNDEQDAPFIPTGKIYIEFLSDSDTTKHEEVFEKWHLSIIEHVFPGAYRVQVTPKSPNPIKCVTALQKHKLIKVAEPEFATIPVEADFDVPRGNFKITQWHYDNEGVSIPVIDDPNALYSARSFKKGADSKVQEAWKYMGSLGSKNIKIAVIDTGFDVDHPMLYGDGTKIRNPFNARDRSSDASPYVTYSDGSLGVFDHGTSCAAVAAGYLQNGVLGVAPNARIIPIRLDILSDEAIKAAFEHAMLNGADIISCSLGYPKPVPLSTYVSNYVRHVARNGRGGKGIPIFFAAGNANPMSNNVPREVSDFAANSEVICVTASNSLDEASSYSFFGANAWICAPSNGNQGAGITTATVQLVGGGLDHTYTSGFGGTSSAAPLVAGVAALMLSVHPNLTATEIRSMLRNSTDKIPGQYDANGHSRKLGYGRVNALKAVKAAHIAAGGTTTTPTGPTAPATPTSTTQKGVVNSRFLNVRSGPGTTFSKVGQLNQGDPVTIFETIGGLWYRIGDKRFVSKDYIKLVASTSSTKTGRVTSRFLNVRSGPSTSFGRVKQIFLNDIVTIYETSPEGWHRIGDGQWVLGSYIKV